MHEFLADQLTLFQPGGTDFAHKFIQHPASLHIKIIIVFNFDFCCYQIVAIIETVVGAVIGHQTVVRQSLEKCQIVIL